MPEREIVTGIGPVAVRAPRVRDRGGLDGERLRFSSAILPPYARRSKSLEVLIPILYLRRAGGASTGHNQLPKVIQGVEFVDGLSAVKQQPQAAA